MPQIVLTVPLVEKKNGSTSSFSSRRVSQSRINPMVINANETTRAFYCANTLTSVTLLSPRRLNQYRASGNYINDINNTDNVMYYSDTGRTFERPLGLIRADKIGRGFHYFRRYREIDIFSHDFGKLLASFVSRGETVETGITIPTLLVLRRGESGSATRVRVSHYPGTRNPHI